MSVATIVWITVAVTLDSAASLVGGLIPDRWLARHRGGMLGFASGALLAAALLDFLPDALKSSGASTGKWLLAAIVALALVEWALSSAHTDASAPTAARPQAGVSRATPFTLLGATVLHNFTDGMAVAAAFSSSLRVGIVASLAVIVHEVPKETADYAVLRAAHVGKRRSLVALLCVQLAAGVGAIATIIGEREIAATGPVLAISTGTFLYIALVDLVPGILHSSVRRERLEVAAALVAGVVLVALATGQ
jgi:zinc and cadmium transporter